MDIEWVYRLKKKILIGFLVFFTLYFLATTIIVVFTLRKSFIVDSMRRTQGLSSVIEADLKRSMIDRSADMQQILDNIATKKDYISSVFIIDNKGKIAYSTNRSDVGRVIDRQKEQSCHVCHKNITVSPSKTTAIIENDSGEKVFRNISVIYNEKPCYGCHPESVRINGKLIIERPLKLVYSFTRSMEITIIGSGIICLIVLLPFLSKQINVFIGEITNKNMENNILYSMVDRLSKTIDMKELRVITTDILQDVLIADEINIVLPKTNRRYKVFTRQTGNEALLRRKVEENDIFYENIDKWLDGKLATAFISNDNKNIYLSIFKGDERFALINCRKYIGTFLLPNFKLVKALCGHISIAFENARLYSIAITDELTNLYTPRHFRYTIELECSKIDQYAGGVTLLFMDVDNFKKVNDTYGHMGGDVVLEGVAQCIKDSIRENDLPFRYGGEELAVILPSTDVKTGYVVAERIRKTIENTFFKYDGKSIVVTISTGVANCPGQALSAKELVLKADNAVYEAKRRGKNIVIITNSQDS
ncbi:MAG: diguanylate cyclase [Nitrospirae bacterium]|nr:diguanylate cyclase [Nitrospirota bacterium]